MGDFAIRAATQADAPTVHALAIQLRDATDAGLPDLTLEWVEHYLADGSDEALLADADGVAVGLLTFRVHEDLFHGGPTALVEELVVDEAWRGRGVGTALLVEVFRIVRERGCVEVAVNTGCRNESAQRFYKRAGLTHESLMLGTHFSAEGQPLA